MSPIVRTVLGDVHPASLGRIDYHEHLFHSSPLLPGEDLHNEAEAEAECTSFLGSGFNGLIDATPIGLGRRPEALARIAAATGATIVAATGRHRDAHYAGNEWIDCVDLAEVFIRELTEGIAYSDSGLRDGGRPAPALHHGLPVRAGLIKVGIDYWHISDQERRALEAASAAHTSTGVPIMVHTERTSAVFEVLDILASGGVPASSMAIAHADRNPDPGLHKEIAAAGAFLGYDGSARYRDWPESQILDCLHEVVHEGHGDRILLGADMARRSNWTSTGGLPGLKYLGERYVPRIRARIGDTATEGILVHNPAAYLTWDRA